MNRPFFNDSITSLEARFEARKTDNDFLKLLAEELSFRSTEKAKKLRLLVLERLQTVIPEVAQIKPALPFGQVRDLLGKSLVDYQQYTIKSDTNIPLTNAPQDILATWIALEVLSPQTFRKEQDLAGASGSIVHFGNSPLPWEGEGEKSKPNYRLYYQIVLGTINFEKAISALLNIYADKRVERPLVSGEAILATIVVDKTGRLVEDPAIGLSSFASNAT